MIVYRLESPLSITTHQIQHHLGVTREGVYQGKFKSVL